MAAFQAKLYDWLPKCADNIFALANGVSMAMETSEGTKVYKTAPSLAANVYLIDRIMGKPRTESSPTDERLNQARAVFIEQQVALGFIEAQVKDLAARGARAETENSMWTMQFVTEEEQEKQLQKLARHANAGIMALTPEIFAEIAPGVKDPAAALQRLKGRVSVTQAEVFEAVMNDGEEVADEEDEGDAEEAE